MADGFKFSVSLSPTKTGFGPLLFAGELEKGIGEIARLGFDGVELSIRNSAELDIKTLANLLKRNNLKLSGVATGQSYYTDGLSPSVIDEEIRHKAIKRLKGHIELASRFGAQVVIGGIRGVLDKDEKVAKLQREAMISSMKECLSYAAPRNVTLTLEPINRYETNFINTVREGLELLREIGGKNMGLLVDTFHMNIEEASIPKSIISAGEYISYVHFADSNRLAPGCGHINFARVIQALRKIGYSGFICAEILPKPNDHSAASSAIKYLCGLGT